MDEHPAVKVAEVSIEEIAKDCLETIETKRNKTLDRFRLLSRKQMPKQSLEPFFQTLKVMASVCGSSAHTDRLVKIFVLDMKILAVKK